MQRNIFRKSALENLSLPDQLNDAIRVTSPGGWIALSAVIAVIAVAVIWSIIGTIPTSIAGTSILMRLGGNRAVTTTIGGQVVALKLGVGEMVQCGQIIAQIRHGGAEHPPYLQDPVIAPCTGRVLEVMANNDDVVEAGTTLLMIEPTRLPLQAVTFVSLAQAKKVRPGMLVRLNPSTARQDEYGYLCGTVRSVGGFAATRGGMMHALSNDNLAEALRADGPVVMIIVDLVADSNSDTEYKWSSSHGAPGAIVQGTICSARVTVEQDRPIRLVIPLLRTFAGL